MKKQQSGFTLVEIAIVLVIIGLLLGGILKGQELINSARVRNLADTATGIQAAYYGFIDRYRQVPGDMTDTAAAAAIGDAQIDTLNYGGDGNGQLGVNGVTPAYYEEAYSMWAHLTRAGFLQGSYNAAVPANAAAYVAGGAPVNAFNGVMLLGRGTDYSTADDTDAAAAGTMRLLLVVGNNVPVDIARELDVKIDDTLPRQGVLRFVGVTATQTWTTVSQASTDCVDDTPAPNTWDITNDAQNCNLAYIY